MANSKKLVLSGTKHKSRQEPVEIDCHHEQEVRLCPLHLKWESCGQKSRAAVSLNTSKIRIHSMPTQHGMKNHKSQIVAGVVRISILTPSERVATQNSTRLRLSLLHSLASHQYGYCRTVQCPSEYVYLLQ